MKSNSLTQNKLYWVYLIGFFLILTLPLLNLPPWFSPPNLGKTIVFRIVLSALIFLFIYQLLFQKTDDKNSTIAEFLHRVKDRKNKVFFPFWLLIALLGIYFLATIFSLDPYFSFWGSPLRSGGFLNFSFYIIFAVLAFLIIRKKDWQKIWDFAIFIGILVSTIAIFQQLGLFSKILIPSSTRPPSTIGGPIFLALYLLLLSFLTFSFALKEKNWLKKIFYFFSFLLFLFVILITGSRAAYFGLFVGLFYFLFLYPKDLICSEKIKTLFLPLKIFAGIVLIIIACGIYYINAQPELPQFIQDNKILSGIAPRLSTRLALDDPRFPVWKISLEVVKEKPIFGYGPENFNIGFDKHYDSSLFYINAPWGSWWDRAHNFIFDISVTAGIPALIIYLSLFGALFWQLQRLKNNQRQSAVISGNQNPILAHGIQATFFGYLAASLFSFDVFSAYLISFLLIGYSLHLISLNQININQQNQYKSEFNKKQKYTENKPWKYIFILVVFCLILWFIFSYNIRQFKINSQINTAEYLVENNKCDEGLIKMDNALQKKSFLDNYARLKYTKMLLECNKQNPDKISEYTEKAISLLKENIEIRPYYIRNWLALGDFIIVQSSKEKNQQKKQELLAEAKRCLEKAETLGPKKQKVFIEWSKYGIVSENYQLMKEKSQKCISLNQKLADCYWYQGLAKIYLGDFKEGNINIEIARKKGYNATSLISLLQLATAYNLHKDYKALAEIYQELINKNPKEVQYHATLAFIYAELGEYKKAREEALKVLELQPEARANVEEFLRSLR